MDMEAGNRMETSDFVVGKGMEAHEADNDEEISEICLAPDLEVAEESRRQELQLQAQKIEEEIVTLKQALDRKEKQLAEIKRLLGITPWTQFRDGIQQQYQNLQGTQMYQKTSDTFKDLNEKIVHSQAYNKLSTGAAATKSVLSDAGSKTASAAKNVGSATAKKIGEIRGSSMFQSLGNRVVSASSSLKEIVVGQKPSSEDEAEVNSNTPGQEEVDLN
ncbi:tumor protein D52-like isoform X1 [Acropora millepora]|uniref:tumor protein D52-like isoform X1 n=1 Tax=Acropora millepora TaxID=45264 RepID=UPI001CF54F22|nr:tumor protein D52-like isoform X1 [Acropora millepora]